MTLLFLGVSCNRDSQEQKKIIAKTDTQVLLQDEIIAAMPLSLSAEDSVAFVKSYVENWLHFALLYEKACDNISDNDSSLSQRVDRFKKELYINQYEQLFLQQKLDTLIPQTAIDEYYKKHKDEYVLERPVVKPILIVFPQQQSNDIEIVDKLFFSKKETDFDELKDYCFKRCQKFYFSDEWVELEAVKAELPFDVRNENLTIGKSFKFTDSLNVYFVKINEQLGTGNRMPLELAHDKIAKIILQTRKIELLKTMRNKVYQDAEHRKQFEVFY